MLDSDRLTLLAPTATEVPASLRSVLCPAAHDQLLASLQRFRGEIYCRDGALHPQQLCEGRHQVREDALAWHLLVRSGTEIRGCIWYMKHADSPFAESGGWASDQKSRGIGVYLILACYALGQLLGGGTAIVTITARHGAIELMHRLGGTPFERIEPYYDGAYDCVMELLGVDIDAPPAKYRRAVEKIQGAMHDARVIVRGA